MKIFAICGLLVLGVASLSRAESGDSVKAMSDSALRSLLTREQKDKIVKLVFHADTTSAICDSSKDFTNIEMEYCRRRNKLWNGK